MRGQRTSIAGKRVDVVVVAARYSSHDHRLQWVQAYERRGKVWGDKVLIDRADLLETADRQTSSGHGPSQGVGRGLRARPSVEGCQRQRRCGHRPSGREPRA